MGEDESLKCFPFVVLLCAYPGETSGILYGYAVAYLGIKMSAECEVCATPFHSNVCNPRLLRCGHTICGSCVAHLIKIRSFFCPFCRASCRSIKSENELPLNRFILDLIERKSNDVCDNNNVNNCLKNIEKSGINENLTSNISTVIPSSIPVVHAGVCQEHGYYRDMRCTSCNISICKQCTYCDHPQNTCRVIPITKANSENHIRFRAKEKSHAVMHNCKYITDNLLTRLPRLEAAAKKQAKAVETLQSELEFQQLLQKEVDDHVSNMKDVLEEGQKRQEVLQRTQQYLEDLENAQNNDTKKVDTSCENLNNEDLKSTIDTSRQISINEAQTSESEVCISIKENILNSISNKPEESLSKSVNEAQSSVIDSSSSVDRNNLVSASNKKEDSISNTIVKCCGLNTQEIPELENTLNHLDITESDLINLSNNPEESIYPTTDDNTCSVPHNLSNLIDISTIDSQVSSEQTNNQDTPLPDSTTDGTLTSNQGTTLPDSTTDDTLPQTENKTDITRIQITNLEDVQKIQKETEHFIQASQYLPWNRTASKLKKTQAIVSHAVELLDLCRTTQGYAPLVNGFLDDDYESEESEDDYDYDDENNGGLEEDGDHTSEDEDDDFSEDGAGGVVVETLEDLSQEEKSTIQTQMSQEKQLLTYEKQNTILTRLLVPFTSLFSSVFSAFAGFKEMMTLPQLLDPHADEKDNFYIDQLFL